MHSPDLTAENVTRLKELFPAVVTEGRDEEGNPIEAIDFDLLRQELSDHVVEGPQERYRLDWPGKRAALFAANAPIAKTLRPVRAESVDFDTTKNLFIEGDNLDALKILQEPYLGKVKFIYIDPPYNTGNDFIYDDDFAESTEEYLERSGQANEEGSRLVANAESNGRFHSDWLSMMYPRLRLARNLLSPDGVIMMSIDDNEGPRARQLCDSIFGAANFIATFVWEKRTNRENRKVVSYRHDYVLCYGRNADNPLSIQQLPMSEKALAAYTNPDNDPRGAWKSDPAHAQAGHGTAGQFYDLVAPNGRLHALPSGRCWAYTKAVMDAAIEDGRIWFGRDGNGVPRIKTYLNAKDRGLTPETMIFAAEAGTNESAKNELKALFDGVAVFDTPKPVGLLQVLLQIGARPDSLVLDFFAGSGSLGEAVLRMNEEDHGSRRYVLVQIDDPVPVTSEAGKLGIQNIAELARQRMIRVGQTLAAEGGEDQSRDLGFRALRVDSTNLVELTSMPDDLIQHELGLLEASVKADRKSEDLLFQVLVDWALDLAMSIEIDRIGRHDLFVVESGALIGCFDPSVDREVLQAIAARTPLRAVFRDSGFTSDADRINAQQIFAEVSPNTDVKVI